MSSRGRHVFDLTSLTDEGIGVQSPDILNKTQRLQAFFLHPMNISICCCSIVNDRQPFNNVDNKFTGWSTNLASEGFYLRKGLRLDGAQAWGKYQPNDQALCLTF